MKTPEILRMRDLASSLLSNNLSVMMFATGQHRAVRAQVPVKSETSFAFFPCLSSNQKWIPIPLSSSIEERARVRSRSVLPNTPTLHHSIPDLDFKGYQELTG